MSKRVVWVSFVLSILSFPLSISGAFADGAPQLLERALSRPRPREWVSSFRPVASEAPESAPQLQADFDVQYAGLQWGKVVVRVLMVVAPESLPAGLRSSAGPEFSISGQVLRGGEPFESFMYKLHARPAGGGVPLVFERYLDPGEYRLRVRLEHLESGSVLVAERELDVPLMQRASAEQAPAAPAPAAVTASVKTGTISGYYP